MRKDERATRTSTPRAAFCPLLRKTKPVSVSLAAFAVALSGCGGSNSSTPSLAAATTLAPQAIGASGDTPLQAQRGTMAATAASTLCVGGTRYATAQDDEFSQDKKLNAVPTDINAVPAPSAMWSTQFSWGRTNNSGTDDAFYTDSSVTPYFSPFTFADQQLSIEAEPIPSADLGQTLYQERNWLSGTLEGKPLTYGYVEVSAREPNLQGFWPAPIWLLGTNGSDGLGHGYSELDGNELFGNSLGSSIVQQTQILNNANPRAANHVRTLVTPNPQTAFHTYGILWTPQTVSFYVDRVATSPAWANDATGPMNPIITLQVFTPNTWAPGPATRTAQHMDLQYFRWYQTTGASCAPAAVSTPLPSPRPSPTATATAGPTATPSPKPSATPAPTATPVPASPTPTGTPAIVQQGPVVASAGWDNTSAVLPTLPTTGDMLLLVAAKDVALTPPPGWKWLAPQTNMDLNIMYGFVGQNGLTAQRTYSFQGNGTVAQILEIGGVSASAVPLLSADPTDYGLVRTRTLAIPAAGGLGLVVWGARSDTAAGGISALDQAVPAGQSLAHLAWSIDTPISGGSGSALTLAVSRITSEPHLTAGPFSVTGTFTTGAATNLTIDGYILWIP